MRLPALASLLLAPAFAGCIGDVAADLTGASLDCSGDLVMLDKKLATVLLSSDVPREFRSQGDAPVAAVEARAGQDVTATVVYQAAAGAVQVSYDGPTDSAQTQVSSGQTAYVARGVSSGGTHTLELVGDPLAMGVGFVIVLAATGCTAT